MASLKDSSKSPSSGVNKWTWIAEGDSTKPGKSICFPETDLKLHSSTGSRGELRFNCYPPMTTSSVAYLENANLSQLVGFSKLPPNYDKQLCLSVPFHHEKSAFTPYPLIAQSISDGERRWGTSLAPRGEITYLCGFWEWSRQVYRYLNSKGELELSLAVHAATMDYHRPNSAYRALCEVWCPQTNTFLTKHGEIGISLWELREISGLSILGEYYEEVIPTFTELVDGKSLPFSCLCLFKAFAFLAEEKDSDRIKHDDWVNFWFRGSECDLNPRKDSSYKSAMDSPRFDKAGNLSYRPKLKRPLQLTERRRTIIGETYDKSVVEDLDMNLSTDEIMEIKVAAYLSLWLCRFILPSGDDHLRVGTFKAASRMAAGVTYSLVPPVLASIYRGLTQTYNHSKDLGEASFSFPGHFFYAWAAAHFRGIFARVVDYGRPIMRRFSGTLNAYQSWEEGFIDCRKLLRGNMSLEDFHWTINIPVDKSGQYIDDGKVPKEIVEFYISIRPGYLSYRRGISKTSYIFEMYNPHRFCRQHGFYQLFPGAPMKNPYPLNPSTLYSSWVTLMWANTGATFYVPTPCIHIRDQLSPKYVEWWQEKMCPILDGISIQVLSDSELPIDEGYKTRGKRKVGIISNILPQNSKKTTISEVVQEKPSSKKLKVVKELESTKSRTPETSLDRPRVHYGHRPPPVPRGEKVIDALDSLFDDDFEINCPSGSLPSTISGGVIPSIEDSHNEDIVDLEDEATSPETSLPVTNPEVFQSPLALSQPVCKESLTSSPLESMCADAMMTYLEKEFKDAMCKDASDLKEWWCSKSPYYKQLCEICFKVDISPLMEKMDLYLKDVDHFLTDKTAIMDLPSLEEKEEQLASLTNQISIQASEQSDLSKKLSEIEMEQKDVKAKILLLNEQSSSLGSKAESIQSEITRRDNKLVDLKESHDKIKEIRVQDVKQLESLDKKK